MEPICPQCGRDFVQRTCREGLLERLLSVAYVYPFRCQLCTHRFRAVQWGKHYARQTVDNREYERFEMQCPARFSVEGGSLKGEGVLLYLSMGGCGLETQAPLKEGMLLRLAIHIWEDQPHIRVETAVVRSVRPTGIGLEFLRFQPDENNRLSQFIRELLIIARRT